MDPVENINEVDDVRSLFSRRNFIKGVIAGAATVSGAGYLFRQAASPAMAQESAAGSVERLITLSKEDNVANRRLAFARLRDKAAVGKLFTKLGPKFKERPGGYTRVLKFGFRPGDNAPMAIIELVEREEAVAE